MEIRVLAKHGLGVREIAREVGVSRNTMRRYLREPEAVQYRGRAPRLGKLAAFEGYIVARLASALPEWLAASVPLRELRERGYLATQRGWKVRFTTATDLVLLLEAAQRQGRLKEVLHRAVNSKRGVEARLPARGKNVLGRLGAGSFEPTLWSTLMTMRGLAGVYRRVEVLTGPGRRRKWSDDDKAKVVAETLEPGAIVAEVARRWQFCPQQVFTWRRELRAGVGMQVDLVPIVVDAATSKPGAAATLTRSTPAIEVKLAGALLRVTPGTDEALLATVLRAIRASAA